MYKILIEKKFYERNIHKASYLIFNEIKNQIEDYHIDTICGWSLGSIVALYISYHIYHKKNLKCSLILFRCPSNFKIIYMIIL